MMPPLKQRTFVILAMVFAGLCYGAMADAMDAGNGSGSSLLAAPPADGSVVAMVVYTVPALLAAIVVAAAGNPLAGFSVLAAGMLVPAWQGGPIDDWLRSVESPAAYRMLAVESVIWAMPFVALALFVRFGRDAIRRKLPGVVLSPYCHEVPDDDPSLDKSALNSAAINVAVAVGVLVVVLAGAEHFQRLDLALDVMVDFVGVVAVALAGLLAAWGVAYVVRGKVDRAEHEHHRERIGAHMAPAFLGGAMTLVFGAVGSFLLQRTSEPGQAVGAVFVGFLVGGFFAHQSFPSPVRLTFVLMPLLLGAAGYLYASFAVGDAVELLDRFYALRAGWLPAPATAMPATFASAGVLGVSIGLGWSQAVFVSREKHVALAG